MNKIRAIGVVLGVFIVGLGLGVVATRLKRSARTGPDTSPAAAAAAQSAAPMSGDAEQTSTTASLSAKPVPASTAQDSLAGAPPDNEVSDEGAGVQRIELGAAFRETLDRTATGYEQRVATAHRALEGETRDVSWADPLEADIRNSLTADVSAGNFKVDHVECRASICEVRLSATDAQAAGLKAWGDNLKAYPWSHRVLITNQLTLSGHGRVDTLMLFMKPPPPPR